MAFQLHIVTVMMGGVLPLALGRIEESFLQLRIGKATVLPIVGTDLGGQGLAVERLVH